MPAAKRLALGVLPSVSQHGLLVNKIAEAVLEVRARHPALAVVVREAPNRILQDWVVRGVVGIAIVETSLPQMARLELGSSEALAVIADPRHNVLPAEPVRLAQLADLPLALADRALRVAAFTGRRRAGARVRHQAATRDRRADHDGRGAGA